MLQIEQTISMTQGKMAAMAFNGDRSLIYTASYLAAVGLGWPSLHVIDVASCTEVDTLLLGTSCLDVAWANALGVEKVFLADQGSGFVRVVDVATMTQDTAISTGVDLFAIAADSSKLWVGVGGGTILVYSHSDYTTPIATISGAGPGDISVASFRFSPDGTILAVVYFESFATPGSVDFIDTSTDTIIANVDLTGRPFECCPRGIAWSLDGTLLYVTAAIGSDSEVIVVDVATATVVDAFTTSAVTTAPWFCLVSAAGDELYVSDYYTGHLFVISLADGTILQDLHLTVGTHETGYLIALPGDTRIFSADGSEAEIVVLNKIQTATPNFNALVAA